MTSTHQDHRPGRTSVAERLRDPAILLGSLIVVVAAALRIIVYAGQRSLWLDEVMAALSIIYRPMAQLFDALAFDQIAPIGWLIVEKLMVEAWPDFELSLRLVPLLFGIGVVVAFYAFAIAAFERAIAVIAVLTVAMSPPLISYSALIKPYIVDAFFSVALTGLAWGVMTDAERRGRWMLLLAFTGIASLTLSFAVVFVMAPVGATLFVHALVHRRWAQVAGLTAMGGVWVALAAAMYFGFYASRTTTIENMQTLYWTGSFAPLPPRSLGEVMWYLNAFLDFFAFAGFGIWPKVFALLTGIGAAVLLVRRPWMVALLTGPIVVVLLASGVEAYPFQGRLLLFIEPQVALLAAAGAVALARLVPHTGVANVLAKGARLTVLALMAALIAVPSVRIVAQEITRTPPFPIEEVKPNLAALERELGHDDLFFVNPAGELPLILYGPTYGLESRPYIVGRHYRSDPSCAYEDVARLTGGRGFLLLYHVATSDREGAKILLDTLARRGDLATLSAEPGSTLYRFDPGPDAAADLPAPPPNCRAEGRTTGDFLDRLSWISGAQ